MGLRFKNKTAVITGAGQGIGFEIARQLVREGASVILNDINEELALSSAAALDAEGPGKCIAIPGDAADLKVIDQLIGGAVGQFGHLDLAVANAGNTFFCSFFEISVPDFRKVIDLNIQGTFFLAQRAARQMRKQGRGGKILLISSNIGVQAYPDLTTYSMTKSALHMMAKGLVLDLSPHNININVVAPGATITERTCLENPLYAEAWNEIIPKRRTAQPRDIADASLFMLSAESEHITGQTLIVDGGWTSTSPYPDFNRGE